MLYDKIEMYKKLTYIDGKFDFENFMKSLKWAGNGFILAGKICDDYGKKSKEVEVKLGYNYKSEETSILRFTKAIIKTPDNQEKEYLYNELYREFSIK